MVINYNLINAATNNAFLVMRGNGKSAKKKRFLKKLSFQLAKPYVSSRKLRGETKFLAKKMGFIDAAANIKDQAVQGVKHRICYRCMKCTRLACSICHRRVCSQHRKMPRNPYDEQFVLDYIFVFSFCFV